MFHVQIDHLTNQTHLKPPTTLTFQLECHNQLQIPQQQRTNFWQTKPIILLKKI